MSGNWSDPEIAAVLTAYRMRPPTRDEILGFRSFLLEEAKPLHLQAASTAIDLCGTGGDGKNTINISTLTAFVVAALGVPVIKHGNYSASSRCGSSNVLEALHVKLSADEDFLTKSLEECSIAFLHAPLFHPAMKAVAPVRKALGFRTFFNLLGPVVNPAKPGAQLLGVCQPELLRLYQGIFQRTGQKYAVVYSSDGYDEISLTSSFRFQSQHGDFEFTPEDLGFPRVKAEEIAGGADLNSSAKLFLRVLQGKGSDAQNAVVAANASVALLIYEEKVEDVLTCLQQNFKKALEVLSGGLALEVYEKTLALDGRKGVMK